MMIRRSFPRGAVAASARASARAASRAGFTLMELLVVVAILVVLVSVATPMYFSYLEKSKIKIAKTSAIQLADELRRFQIENGSLPPVGTWDSLALNKPPIDPWNNLYQWQTKPSMAGGVEISVPIVWSTGPTGNWGPYDGAGSDGG